MEINCLIKRSDMPAIFWQGQTISYRSVLSSIGNFAAILPQSKGFKAAILSENRPEWIYALYAIWQRRGIPVLFDGASADDELIAILNAARPEAIFCSERYCSRKLRAVLGELSYSPVLHIFEELAAGSEEPAPERVAWSAIDDTALIVYTSGTTGAQKGARLSFRNLASNLEPIMEFASPQDSTLLLLPLFHIFPLLWTVIAPLYAGICTVIAPSLDPAEIRTTLRQYPVTAIVGVPALFERIRKTVLDALRERAFGMALFRAARAIGSRSFSRFLFRSVHAQFGGRVRYLICGGAALGAATQRDLRALGFPIYTGYGLTETSPMVSFNKPGSVKLGSVGRPIPRTEVRIVDGEIVVRGENVMQQYDDRPEETRMILRDGWLSTGDLGRIDEDGYLFVTGRKKEIIVLPNGKNVNPEEVETRLSSFTRHVRECAVYERNSKLAALIVPAASNGAELPALRDEVRSHVIDAYNRTAPLYRKIVFFTLSRDPLPRTTLGKLKRSGIPAFAEERSAPLLDGDQASAASSPLLRYIQKEIKPDAAFGHNLVLDLGLDSLDMAVLSSYIESNYNIALTPEDVAEHQTIGALSAFLQRSVDAAGSGEHDWRRLFDSMEEVPLPKTWWTIAVWQWMTRFAYRFMLHVTIEGKESIPPEPVIFAANHQSSLDAFLVTSFLTPRQFRRTFYLAKEVHCRAAWKRWLVDRHNVVLVHSSEDVSGALRTLARCLEENRNVLIFPEGTRSADGSVTGFKRTFALLSCALQVPVVPVVIDGTLEALPKGMSFPKYGVPVSVRFLDPVYPDGHTPASLSEEIETIIQEEAEKNRTLAQSGT